MTSLAKQDERADRGRWLIVAGAAAITILDGFDAFSLSLTAPKISADLGIPTSALAAVFASNMGGMIFGAFLGGALADKLGRTRVLMVALAFFGLAALTMPFVRGVGDIVFNRVIGGMGLGAAAPIAVALLSRCSAKPPSQFIISAVWAGISIGGILAAMFNYLVVSEHGWRSIFVTGGLLPIPVAVFAYLVFHQRERAAQVGRSAARPRLGELFAPGQAGLTIATGLMFLFGYVTTSIIVNWLPTILNHRQASALMISITFGGINVGGVVGAVALGWVGARARSAWTLALAWAFAGLCGLVAAAPALGNATVATVAVLGASVAAGAQGLSVAFAAQLHRARSLESTSVGFMTSMGRIGQFSALSATGALLGMGWPETSLFAFAAVCAAVAAVIAFMVVRNAMARGEA